MPLLVALAFFRPHWQRSFWLMLATMLVDSDHLLATPIYDPQRCSIGFHPLHQFFPIAIYVALCFLPKTRLIGIGLVIHMALDSLDCFVNGGVWYNPA